MKTKYTKSDIKFAFRMLSYLLSIVECLDKLNDTPFFRQKIKYHAKGLLAEIERFIADIWKHYYHDGKDGIQIQVMNEVVDMFNRLLDQFEIEDYDKLFQQLLEISKSLSSPVLQQVQDGDSTRACESEDSVSSV